MTKVDKQKQIYREIKTLHGRIHALNLELNRLEIDGPEPIRFDPDFIPPFLRKDYVEPVPRRSNQS